jgi:hypothetical protein
MSVESVDGTGLLLPDTRDGIGVGVNAAIAYNLCGVLVPDLDNRWSRVRGSGLRKRDGLEDEVAIVPPSPGNNKHREGGNHGDQRQQGPFSCAQGKLFRSCLARRAMTRMWTS